MTTNPAARSGCPAWCILPEEPFEPLGDGTFTRNHDSHPLAQVGPVTLALTACDTLTIRQLASPVDVGVQLVPGPVAVVLLAPGEQVTLTADAARCLAAALTDAADTLARVTAGGVR